MIEFVLIINDYNCSDAAYADYSSDNLSKEMSLDGILWVLLSKFTIRQQSWMRNQEDKNQLTFTFSPRRSAAKINTNKQPLANLITTLQKQQHRTFSTLSQKCSSIEYAIATIQVLVAQMGEKVQKFNQSKESQMLANLKMKQSQFIISQLKSTITKQSRKEEKIIEELESQKKKSQKYREQVYRLEAQNSSLSQKIAILQGNIRKKTQQMQNYTLNFNKQRQYLQNQTRNRVKSTANRQSLMSIRSNQQYAQLQEKLEQLQKQFNSEIQKLVSKNNDLNLQIKKIQNANYQYISTNKMIKKELEELAVSRYELQIKSKQDSIQMSELEQSYNKLVEKSNNNQIMLHKQLQDYKIKQAQIKNQYKKEKKLFKAYLSNLAEYINSSRYYFTANQLKDQIQEMKKLFDKNLKKRLQNSTRQLDYYQGQYKKIKLKAQQTEFKLNQLQKSKLSNPPSLKEIEVDIAQRGQRNSQNGSLLHNRSGDRSQQQKYRNVEQKYKNKLQLLRKQIKTKQTKINQLQKMQQTQFDKSKQKILQLQFQISQKINQIRKCQLKFKQQDYQSNELQNKIKELQGKIKFLTQRIQSEKQSNSKLIELKSQSYEQKMKLIKTNYRQLQKKQQQKTIKYNKLKARYQKYQLEASESLKRKNLQIDQLLKENNKLKTQNKLLQEKININHIIQNEISSHKTPNNTNQDLIEQIQMERDRINIAVLEKEKKISELVELNEKINSDIMAIKRQNRELKNRIEEIIRQQRVLKEENKYAKEKIQQLSKNNKKQDQEKYSYFKKQLQKSVMSNKKLQKTCQKYQKQRQQRKKQLQQKDKQINNLKTCLQKSKQKKMKFKSQLIEQKQSKKRLVIDYDRKLSQCATRQQQLVNIINYKNRQGQGIRQSMKGQQLIIQEQAKIKFNVQTMTETIILMNKSINTDTIHHENEHKNHSADKPIIPSELILNNQFAFDDSLEKQHKIQPKKQQNPVKLVNYFGDLIQENIEDNFDICDQGQQQNIKTSLNGQLKQLFNMLRQQIQKLFNGQDISVSAIKQFPKQLQDDFNDFISYIKQKIHQIQNQNNLTFIMAEAGNQPQNIQIQLQQFIAKPSIQYIQLKKIIEEKEVMITSLMNQKTQQENTITQHQNMQEQTERLHLQQYSVLKNQIHQQKINLDKQILYYQSLKNIIKKMMNYWIEDEDNYDDFQDNLQLIPTIYKFNTKQLELLKLYLKKYKELKQI